MYIPESYTCPYCNHTAASAHHLFTSSLECGGCGIYFLAPISKVFRDLKRENITMSRAAEILEMRLVEVREVFNVWDAHFYPRDEAEKAAAVAWEWKARLRDCLTDDGNI